MKNKNKGTVDKMSVNGIIRNNILEVFPFVLNIDRYTVAASGLQHLDESYNYHISVIKSPLLVKFGVNVFGKNFDEMKFRVGKARYRNTNVPVFTKQLDTVQYSLINSIHNIFEIGVEKAIRENREQDIVQQKMDQINYSSDVEVDTLSAVQLDSLRARSEALDNPSSGDIATRIDSLQAQVRDYDEFADEADDSPASMRQAIREGKKAERELEKAIRKEEKEQKKAAKKQEKARKKEEAALKEDD